MRRINCAELSRLLPPAPMYSIMLEKYASEEEAERNLNNISMRMKRLCKKAFPSISFYAVASKTSGKNAWKTVIKTGERGRPKLSITGDKELPHIHIAVYGEKSATFCKRFTSSVNRDAGKTIAKYEKVDVDIGFLGYIYRQGYMVRKYGALGFEAILDIVA